MPVGGRADVTHMAFRRRFRFAKVQRHVGKNLSSVTASLCLLVLQKGVFLCTDTPKTHQSGSKATGRLSKPLESLR